METSLTRKVPYFLNDLGVREFREIKESLHYLSKQFHFRLLPTEEIIKDLSIVSIEHYAYWLDMTAFLTGDYEALEYSVLDRLDEIKANKNYTTLIFAGTVLSSRKNLIGIELFKYAQSQEVTNSLLDSAVAMHRIAVTYIKRYSDYNRGEYWLNRMVECNFSTVENNLMILALVNNLYSLLMLKKNPTAWHDFGVILINENAKVVATSLLESQNISDETRSQAVRYLSQININRAQILQKQEQFILAKDLLLDNIEMVKKYAPFYISEAKGMLAYAYFLMKDYENALLLLEDAIELYASEGGYRAVIFMYQLMLAIHFEKGNHDKVTEIAFELAQLGIEVDV